MNNRTLKLATVSTLALLMLAGCEKREKDDIAVAEPVVVDRVFDCGDFSLQNRLHDLLQNAILEASLARLVGLPSQQAYQIEAKIRQQILNISIETNNISNDSAGCVADVLITPNAEDMLAADYGFQASGISMTDRAASVNAQVSAGRISAQGLDYRIVDNRAVLNNAQEGIVGFVADIMVAAATSNRVAGDVMSGTTQPQAMQRGTVIDDNTGAALPPAVSNTISNNTNTTVTRRVEEAPRPQQPKRAEPTRSVDNGQAATTTTEVTRTPKRVESAKQPESTADMPASPANRSEPASAPKQSLPSAPTASPAQNATIAVVETEDTY